jgi:hypothetical protein
MVSCENVTEPPGSIKFGEFLYWILKTDCSTEFVTHSHYRIVIQCISYFTGIYLRALRLKMRPRTVHCQ